MSGAPTDATRLWLTRLSLAAGMVYTASAEYQLARTLGANEGVAAMLPVAIDAYVIAALRWFRSFDIALSLALMGTAQVAAHLLDAGVMTVNITMVVVVSLLVPVSIWRTHALARTADAVPEAVGLYNIQTHPEVEAPADKVPAELAPEPITVERVAEPISLDVIAGPPVLGPWIPVAELLAGTGRDQGERLSFAGTKGAPEPAEPATGTGGTGSSSGEVPPGVAVEHVTAAREWLTANPELSGTAIGTRLGKSDGYGRRVKRAALAR